MKRAHWFTRLRVALRVWRLRRKWCGLDAQIAAIIKSDGPIDAAQMVDIWNIGERRKATRAELRALGVEP